MITILIDVADFLVTLNQGDSPFLSALAMADKAEASQIWCDGLGGINMVVPKPDNFIKGYFIIQL